MSLNPPLCDRLARARVVLTEKFGLSFDGVVQRELFLTHRLIAKKAGYEGLLKAYADRGGIPLDLKHSQSVRQ